MLLEDLAKTDSIEDAAMEFAGNWRKWSCFVWFGADDIPNNHNVCLGYLVVNADPTINQLSNSEIVKEKLAEWMGEHTGVADVGPFGSSVSGDKNVLGGIQIRVYNDDMTITDAFKKLYELAQECDENCGVLDQDRWNEVNERECLRYLTGELPWQCSQKGVEYHDDMPSQCFSELSESENMDYDYLDHDAIEEWVDQLAESQRRDEKHGLHPQHEDVAN